METKTEITTVGHSNHTLEVFLGLLRQHAVTLVVDVRSQPYSRWADQFNREPLRDVLEEAGIGYRYMGDRLGGRPADPDFYQPGKDRPDYRKMEAVPAYQQALGQLIELAGRERIAVMCSEGDHRQCHRHLLITQSLLDEEVHVRHIQSDGTLAEGTREAEQLSLFG